MDEKPGSDSGALAIRKSTMLKTVEAKEDGRILIYYSFIEDDQDEKDTEDV